MVRGDYSKALKQRIEKEFEGIKAATEGSGSPRLTDAQRAWLVELTGDVVKYVQEIPPFIAPRLLPVSRLLVAKQLT